jgi:hypothetical protein
LTTKHLLCCWLFSWSIACVTITNILQRRNPGGLGRLSKMVEV